MLCDLCCRRQSFFMFKYSSRSFNLCFDCAKKYDCLSLGKKSPKELESQFENLSRDVDRMQRTCPECGTKASEVIINHKVGCSECYNFFLDEISEYFNSIGVNVKESEFFDQTNIERAKKEILRATLATLQEKINKAVETEEYEKAAIYRDKMNELKKSLSKSSEEKNAE